MTTLNTIIEEEKSEGISVDDNRECNRIEREMKNESPITKMHYVLHWVITKYNKKLTTAMQRAYEAGQSEERQFILNVLDGVDIADGYFNTKAIRFALDSRIIKNEDNLK